MVLSGEMGPGSQPTHVGVVNSSLTSYNYNTPSELP